MMEAEQLGAGDGGKRIRVLWELRQEERETKLRSKADELESMMEAEQLGAGEFFDKYIRPFEGLDR